MQLDDERMVMAFLHSQGLHRFEGVTAKEIYDELYSQYSCPTAQDPERRTLLKDATDGLSADAKEVMRLIFNSPKELIEYVWGPGPKRWPSLFRLFDARLYCLTQQDLRNYLRHRGWKHLVISCAFDEIRNFVKII